MNKLPGCMGCSKSVLNGKESTIQAHTRKQETSQKNSLTFNITPKANWKKGTGNRISKKEGNNKIKADLTDHHKRAMKLVLRK